MSEVELVAQRLIAIDSRSPVSNTSIADYIVSYLAFTAEKVDRIEYTDANGVQKVSLVVQLGKGRGGVALSAHMDTVPPLDWKGDPFEAQISEDKVYGLGACDMKGPLACTLVAARAYESLKVKKPLLLIYTSDEETTKEGARRVLAESQILSGCDVQSIVVAEPTELKVVNAHKSDITFIITSRGRAAHSASGKGINANLKMIPFLQEAWQISQELQTDEAYIDSDFDPPYPDWNIVIDNFGCAPNITVPLSRCTIKFRYTSKIEPQPLVQRVEEAASRNGLEVNHCSGGRPLYTPADSSLVQGVMEVTGRHHPLSASFGTDASVLGERYPCIVLGPGSFAQAHTAEEWISRQQLDQGVELYRQVIRKFCQ